MNDPKLVGIAQVAVAKSPDELCCLGLGSCVAVFIYDPQLKIGGVLHALLPRAPPTGGDSQAKYADTGVRKLHSDLVARGAVRGRMRAKLVGGAQMFPNLDVRMNDIGTENCKEARRVLHELGVPVLAEDVHGKHGRSATFCMETGKILIKGAFQKDKVI
jgi:chemotaxis protein CheD